MIISSWNIRGFNDPIKQQEVRGYLLANNIDIFGLLETRVKKNNAAAINRSFASYQLLHRISNQTIHITFIYGSNDAGVRKRLWDYLRGLSHRVTNWIILGDFNIVRVMEERVGPNPPSLAEILAFNQCLLDCQLDDLHSFGCEHTWTNKREVNARIWSKLDRVLANPLWLVKYPQTQVNILPSGISDHSPLLVTIQEAYKPKKRFSYLNCWEEHPNYASAVTQAWVSPVRGNAMFRLFGKLKNVKRSLITLHKSHFSDISKRVKQARASLTECKI
ncbi:uncharacterized protein LOC141648984 [Silene latifolia]|uniref:uncharacterized protein LOC141648984 n=1 Tax=Silene latifolia TaxID=37657 RepID=UPI003D7852F1